jgi:endonuclease/exonuclease/phosphatase family metal-dependent hydrolase
MSKRTSLAAALILLCAPALAAQQPDLSVMTFNVRYAHTNPPNLWADRRAAVAQVIRESDPDIVGTQEGLYPQLVDMAEDLPDYEWLGLGREGGSHGEFMAVYYRSARLEPLEYDHFWLSDTPSEIGSRSWGNNIPRMVTWIRFRDRATARDFYLVNTHFDHQSQPSRERSAELLLEHVSDFDPTLPVIVTGDFNSEAAVNPVYLRLTAPEAFSDSWAETEEAEPEIGTYHDFRGPEEARGRARIDWILTRGPIEALDTEILTDAMNGQYPSDHFPVIARLRFR